MKGTGTICLKTAILRRLPSVLGLAVLAGLLMTPGCNKSGQSASQGALVANGQQVFASNGCQNCHSLNGQGGHKGPDLTHVGADPQHTPQWLAQHVKNPRSQNPSSRMPAFAGRISGPDLDALGAYLASLK